MKYNIKSKPLNKNWRDIIIAILLLAFGAYCIETTLHVIDVDVCSKVSYERYKQLNCSEVMND